MAFLDRFRRRELRDIQSLTSIPSNVDGYSSDAGYPVSERTALQSLAVYACVRLLADSIAALPMDAYRKQGEVRVPVEPAPLLVRQPDTDLTTFEWVFQLVTSLALRGNSYHLVESRDRLEYPTTLTPLHPDIVQVTRDRDTGQLVYKVGDQRVPTEDIVHIRRFSLPGATTGLSPIEQARQGIGMALAAERYGARYFGQAATPSAVLSTEQYLTPTQSKDILDVWVASHGGQRHPAVLSGGLKYAPIAISPEESQFLQTRSFQRGEIAMLFGIPPHMIGDTQKSTSWGSGIEQQSIGFVTYTLRPWLSCIEATLSALLPRGTYMRFNVDALLRGDSKSRFEGYTQARNAGWLNVNEIRALEDRAPIANGDDYLQPLNMGPLGSDPLAAKDADPAADLQEDPNA